MNANQNLTTAANSHKWWVKVSHWIITVAFFALAYSGFIILMCHPRLYWGDVGNDLTPALFELPISRNYQHGGWEKSTTFFSTPNSPITAGRTYDIFNKNSWGRSLHFLAAWVLVIAGVIYLLKGFISGHFRKHLLPSSNEFTMHTFRHDLVNHFRLLIPTATGGPQYGLLQKYSYLGIIFFLLPLTALTGLAMSPAITAAYPFLITMFFGAQSARTIHFFSSVLLVLFVIVHVLMVIKSGFKKHMRSMTIGH